MFIIYLFQHLYLGNIDLQVPSELSDLFEISARPLNLSTKPAQQGTSSYSLQVYSNVKEWVNDTGFRMLRYLWSWVTMLTGSGNNKNDNTFLLTVSIKPDLLHLICITKTILYNTLVWISMKK